MNKQPEATARTRKKLMDSFWKLFCEKGIAKVTVGDIAKGAQLNRGTFYEYFTDMYDLLNQIEDELIEQMKQQVVEAFPDGITQSFSDFSQICADIFMSHGDMIYVLLSEHGDSAFALKMQKHLLPTILDTFSFSKEDFSEASFEYIMTFAFSAMTGMLSLWYRQGKQISAEEFFKIMQSLIANGILGYTNKNVFK